MRKTIITLTAFVFFGCSEGRPRSDAKSTSILPTSSDSSKPNLIVLGKYDVSGGWLNVYKFGNDTLYLAEGTNSSYPISVSVK